MRRLMLALAIVGLAAGWTGGLLAAAKQFKLPASALGFMALASMGYIIFDHIAPLLIFRGRHGRSGATEVAKAVSASGACLASIKIAPAYPSRGLHAAAMLYPGGIRVKQPFLSTYAVLLQDITGIERKTYRAMSETRLTHTSPYVQSPLVLATWKTKRADEFFEKLTDLRRQLRQLEHADP